MSTDPRRALGARSARVYYVYARAVDEGDLDTLRAMVTDDIQITRGDHPTEDGVEAFLDVYRAHNALDIPVCKHVVTNVLAEQDGDDVVTHAYFEATMLEEEQTRVVIGVYDDVHREVDGELQARAQEDPRAAAGDPAGGGGDLRARRQGLSFRCASVALTKCATVTHLVTSAPSVQHRVNQVTNLLHRGRRASRDV